MTKVILKSVYINSKNKEGKPYVNKNGEPFKMAIIESESGNKASKYLGPKDDYYYDIISEWKEGTEVDIEITESNGFKNFNPVIDTTSQDQPAPAINENGQEENPIDVNELGFQIMNTEQQLREWLLLNSERATGLSKLKWETSLHGAYEMLSRDVQEQMLYEPEKVKVPVVGRIDLIFTHQGKRYCSELKLLDYTSGNFWDALKILGYTALYNWQNKKSYKPAVMIPINKIKLEHHIIAGKLNFTIFGITKIKDEYIIEIVKADKFKKNQHPPENWYLRGSKLRSNAFKPW